MKFFTRALIERYGSDDSAVANAADTEWEKALEAYELHLRAIEPELPEHIREFNRLLLHDALVCNMGRRDDRLIMVLLKEIPPCQLVILTYTLTEEPMFDRAGLTLEPRAVLDFQCDELDVVHEGGEKIFTQSIRFGTGLEMTLRFRDLKVVLADPIDFKSRSTAIPPARVSRSA